MRARAVRDAIAAFDDHVDDGRERLRAIIPEQSWAVITEARGLGWIPLEHDQYVPASIAALLGPVDAHMFFRSLLVQQLRTPMLRSTVAATLRVLGLSPASLARAAPIGWDVVYRGFGKLKVQQRGATSTALTLEQVPPEVFDAPGYAPSFRGFFAGLLDVCRVPGDAELQVSPAGHRIEIVLSWETRPSVSAP